MAKTKTIKEIMKEGGFPADEVMTIFGSARRDGKTATAEALKTMAASFGMDKDGKATFIEGVKAGDSMKTDFTVIDLTKDMIDPSAFAEVEGVATVSTEDLKTLLGMVESKEASTHTPEADMWPKTLTADWKPQRLKFPTKCSICGKRLEVDERAYGIKHGPISKRTGAPTWIYECTRCHGATPTKEGKTTRAKRGTIVDGVKSDEDLKTRLERENRVIAAEIAVEEKKLAAEKDTPGTLANIRMNAILWGG